MSGVESHAVPQPICTSTPSEERTLALVAHLLGILTSFVGALVIWLISKGANPSKPLATDQAKESTEFPDRRDHRLRRSANPDHRLVWHCVLDADAGMDRQSGALHPGRSQGHNNGQYYLYPFMVRPIK